MAAYSFLMPGFPDANSKALSEENVNKYDVAAAQKLLADTAIRVAKGFLPWRCGCARRTRSTRPSPKRIASMIKDNLGIDVQVSQKEQKLFMDTLNAHKLQFYYLSYGFDYLDPSNMLGIWVTGGRHTWSNPQFDSLIKQASSTSPATRPNATRSSRTPKRSSWTTLVGCSSTT